MNFARSKKKRLRVRGSGKKRTELVSVMYPRPYQTLYQSLLHRYRLLVHDVSLVTFPHTTML